jgi:hypothetical protein
MTILEIIKKYSIAIIEITKNFSSLLATKTVRIILPPEIAKLPWQGLPYSEGSTDY